MGATVTLTVEQFRQDFPQFTVVKYSDEVVQNFITQAECYVSTQNMGKLRDGCRILAIEYMTAHLIALNDKIKAGNTQGGQLASSSIDKISVSLTPPPSKNMFQYWIGQTTYGLSYYALLSTKCPAGIFAGGCSQRVFR